MKTNPKKNIQSAPSPGRPKWSKLYTIHELLEQSDLLKSSEGVYGLHWVDGSQTRSIPRFLKSDSSGLLYIGCTKKAKLFSRIKNIATALKKENTQMHTLGIRIHELPWRNHMRIEDIRISYILSDEPESLEREMQINYLKKFGEDPPWNSKVLRLESSAGKKKDTPSDRILSTKRKIKR